MLTEGTETSRHPRHTSLARNAESYHGTADKDDDFVNRRAARRRTGTLEDAAHRVKHVIRARLAVTSQFSQEPDGLVQIILTKLVYAWKDSAG
jgi:hypothetical protein